jgi:hypothetical protein
MTKMLAFLKVRCWKQNSALGSATEDFLTLREDVSDKVLFASNITENEVKEFNLFTLLDRDIGINLYEAGFFSGSRAERIGPEKTIQASAPDGVFVEKFRGTGGSRGSYNLMMAVVTQKFDRSQLNAMVSSFVKPYSATRAEWDDDGPDNAGGSIGEDWEDST